MSDHNIQEQGIIDLNEFKRWAWKVLNMNLLLEIKINSNADSMYLLSLDNQ